MQQQQKNKMIWIYLCVWISYEHSCPAATIDTSTTFTTNGDFQLPDVGTGHTTVPSIDGWSGTSSVQVGSGHKYSDYWAPGNQVVELATSDPVNYTQTNNLTAGQYFFSLQYAPRKGKPFSTSCMRIYWDDQVIFDTIPSTYLVQTFSTYITVAEDGLYTIMLEGCGSGGRGMTVDNVQLYQTDDGNRETVTLGNGSQMCLCQKGYFDDGVNSSCVECQTVAAGCQDCSYLLDANSSTFTINNFICSECSEGEYSTGSECQPCWMMSSGCTNCSTDGLQCYDCLTNNFLIDLSIDNRSLHYNYSEVNFTNSSIICVQCSISECITCSSLDVCSQCNQTNNYFLHPSNGGCEECVLEGCVICVDLYLCGMCDSNLSYYYNNGTCEYCNSTDNMFINTTFHCQLCSLDDCIQCGSLLECLECNSSANYFLNESTLLCEFCDLEACAECQSLHSCSVCDVGYGLELIGNVTLCRLWNQSVCGDGIVGNGEHCDDGDEEDGDGCWQCEVEQYFICAGQPSHCLFVDELKVIDVNVEVQKCNYVLVELTVHPIIPIVVNAPLKYLLSNIHPNLTLQKVNQKSTSLIASFLITNDIIDPTLTLHINPFPQFTNSTLSYNPITLKSFLPPIKYSEEQCALIDRVTSWILAVQIISYLVFGLSLIFNCKLIGLELFGVLQLAYFSLSEHYNWIIIYLYPLLQLTTVNGYNFSGQEEEEYVITMSEALKQMEMKSLFWNNWNIMMIVTGSFLLVFSVIFIIISRQAGTITKGRQDMIKRVFKEGLLTIMMFGCFGFVFFMGIHWEYSSPNEDNFVLSTFFLYANLIILLATFYMVQLTDPKTIGQFKNSFKADPMCQLYIVITLLYRISLALYLSLANEYQESTLIALGFCLLYILYNAVNLPYKSALENYRSNTLTITQFIILIVANFYRSMKSTTSISEKGRMYEPAILMLVAITLSMGLSLIVLIYNIYKWGVQKCKPEKKEKKTYEYREMITPQYL